MDHLPHASASELGDGQRIAKRAMTMRSQPLGPTGDKTPPGTAGPVGICALGADLTLQGINFPFSGTMANLSIQNHITSF